GGESSRFRLFPQPARCHVSVFLTQVCVHKTDANLGHRANWAEVPRERGARSGVNKKHFGGTAGSRDLPKNSRAFARDVGVRDASLIGQAVWRGGGPYVGRCAAASGKKAGHLVIL